MRRDAQAEGLARLVAFVELGRPHFLAGGFLLYGLGVAAAHYAGVAIDWQTYVWGQVVVTATQFMTHYANDYFDVQADRLNQTPTAWSGGSRVLADGRLSPRVALVAACILAAIAFGAMGVIMLEMRPGWPTLAIFGLAWGGAWFYSAPPLRLHSTGFGELSVALVVPGLTPALGCYLQAGRVTLPLLLAIIPLVGLQFAMLLMINFPDEASDAASGKRTLVIRRGAQPVARLYRLVLVLVYATLPVLVALGLPFRVAAAVGIGLPLAAWQAWRMWRGAWQNPAQWGSLGFWSVALLVGTSALELAAFVSLL